MKTTIAGFLVRNAIEYVERAQAAHSDSHPDQEARFSIGAHLMIALAIEGIGNEVAEVAFDTWSWSRIEKCDTPLKWYLLSGFGGRKTFNPGKEPLQTVQRLTFIRNRLAHPKIEDLGSEIIIRSKDGEIRRNVGLDENIKAGDFVILGFGKLIDEFNVRSAIDATKKGIEAIKTLRQHLAISGLDWINDMEKDFPVA